jgi:hypothetical protein
MGRCRSRQNNADALVSASQAARCRQSIQAADRPGAATEDFLAEPSGRSVTGAFLTVDSSTNA